MSKFCGGRDPNSNKIHWMSWDLTIASKEKGGIGIGSIEAFDHALLKKWRWRFMCEKEVLWVQFVSEISRSRYVVENHVAMVSNE